MILAIFDLQVTLMLPTKFGVSWPFGTGEEAKNRFSRWRPSWISDWNDFSYFVCVEVLQPSQPNWVMLSAVSLPNHTFTGQA